MTLQRKRSRAHPITIFPSEWATNNRGDEVLVKQDVVSHHTTAHVYPATLNFGGSARATPVTKVLLDLEWADLLPSSVFVIDGRRYESRTAPVRFGGDRHTSAVEISLYREDLPR